MITRTAPNRWNLFKAAKSKARGGLLLGALAWVAASFLAQAAPRLDNVGQLLVGIAPGWDSNQGRLQRFERRGSEWKAVGEPIAVLFGRTGLVWGRGILGTDEPGPHKTERDGRAP